MHEGTSWFKRQCNGAYAEWLLYAISFAESSFFPMPPDPILISLNVFNRDKIFRYALFCTLTSVAGGFLGYFIGAELFSSIGVHILSAYSYEERFFTLIKQFNEWAFWIIALKGLTPIPFKLVTIASGVAGVPLLTFGAASVLARGFRFTLIAILCYFYGNEVKTFINKYQKTSIILLIGVTILGFILLFFV